MVAGSGTKSDPWQLHTAPGTSAYTMYRDETADPPTLVCQVGTTTLRYHLRAVDDLHAWLREQGRTEAVARELHVHPQTVRYRLARLRELFGDVLERPDGRFELEVALRAGARYTGGPEPGR